LVSPQLTAPEPSGTNYPPARHPRPRSIILERRVTSHRNGGRDHLGMPGRHHRNQHGGSTAWFFADNRM